MRRGSRAAGIGAAICWTLFVITLVIRLTAGNGGLLAAEMLENAPPERTGLPETEYPGVGEMTAGYLTGKRDEFQYTFTNVSGEEYVCFQPHEAAHMADCRGLILLDGWVCLGTLAAGLGLAAAGLRRKENRGDFLRGILTGLGILAAVAAGMAIWAAVNFDGLFVTFHRVAFRNDGWLLDPRTDLLIRLMPESFFIRLGLRGGAISLAGAAALAAAAGIGFICGKRGTSNELSGGFPPAGGGAAAKGNGSDSGAGNQLRRDGRGRDRERAEDPEQRGVQPDRPA